MPMHHRRLQPEDLQLLTNDNLFHVQLSDLAGMPRELARDADRVLPGDGDIFLEPIYERLKAIDYRGTVAVELLNPEIWQLSPIQVAEVALTALRVQLGLNQN